MANIVTRNDPFQDLARFDPFREFESFFPMPRSMRRWMAEMPAEAAIKLEVSEDDKAYHVKAELPGVKKEGETVVHSERYYGRQYRSFTLDKDIDRAKAEAKFENGVLDLTLPKNGDKPAQRVQVQ